MAPERQGSPGGGSADHDEDVELARAMDALDALELDVRRGRGAGDEGDGLRVARGGLEGGDRVGDGGDDLLRVDHAEVVVGDECERAPAGFRATVEDDRAGLGDRERAAG